MKSSVNVSVWRKISQCLRQTVKECRTIPNIGVTRSSFFNISQSCIVSSCEKGLSHANGAVFHVVSGGVLAFLCVIFDHVIIELTGIWEGEQKLFTTNQTVLFSFKKRQVVV